MRMTSSLYGLAVVASVLSFHSPIAAQGTGAKPGWTPPRTAWGHPDLEGVYTNKDEANTPLERPDELKGKSAKDFSESELEALDKERIALAAKIAGGIGGAETGAGPTHWYEHLQGKGSRPWFIIDPADGKLPPMTPQAKQREAAAAALNNARNGEGRADSWLDRSMYDRCITRGLPGSMMPVIYGNAYDITQAPGVVAIRYEMIHETRVIPLNNSPRTGLRSHMGDARGHWEGDTLVVETTNFDPRTAYRQASPKLVLIERFRPIARDKIEWAMTVNDPDTWVRPWTFAMRLTADPEQGLFEYACHEGNYAMRNILSGARAAEKEGGAK